MDDMYLDNIEELICDENKIVTYKQLSVLLKVDFNIAKQMLYTYAMKQKKLNVPLHATYFISGIVDSINEEIYKVLVVRECDLDYAKSLYKKIVSVHVYSVQKSQLNDLSLLYGCDYNINETEANNLHNSSERAVISNNSNQLISKNDKVAKEAEKISPSKKTLEKSKVLTVIETKDSDKKCRSKAVEKSEKSLFKNLERKSASQEHNSVGSKKQKVNATRSSQKSKNCTKPINYFLNNQSSKKVISKAVSQEDAVASSGFKKKPEFSISTESKKSTLVSNKKSSLNKLQKRRRIIGSSSSSESEDNEEDSESPIPSPSPTQPDASCSDEDPIPPTPQNLETVDILSKKKRKTKKVVDKTFVDEKEFLVTKKEYVTVTDSEDEEEPVPKENNSTENPLLPPPSTVVISQKRKQSSITSFFFNRRPDS